MGNESAQMIVRAVKLASFDDEKYLNLSRFTENSVPEKNFYSRGESDFETDKKSCRGRL